MKLTPLLFSLLFFLGITVSTLMAQEEAISYEEIVLDALDPDILDQIEQFCKPFPSGTQLSVALLSEDTVRYVGISKQNEEYLVTDLQNAIFEIGSITKVFTSTLLAHAVTDGIIEMDDPINPHLPITMRDDTEISFVSLSNHSSGLPRLTLSMMIAASQSPTEPYLNIDQKMLYDYLQNDLQVASTKGKYAYSNVGAGLLAQVLSNIYDQDYESALQDKIFAPLGMSHSSIYPDRLDGSLIQGLNPDGAETPHWDFNGLVGCGGILSTSSDLTKFLYAQLSDNQAYQLTHNKTLEVATTMDVALGWHILHTQSGKTWLWHNGGVGGFTSSMTLDKSAKKGVVVLSNVSAYHPSMSGIDQLAFGLLNSLY